MRRVALIAIGLSLAAQPSSPAPLFVEFESGPVRPVALSPNGQKLFAANTPDGQLEVFDVSTHGVLTHTASVQVGLEPVAVAPRTNAEVWVVNHLSDSVSIVDVASSPPRVVRTLLVGDEPRDIVFAGTSGSCASGCAFVSTAHRGQHRTHASLTSAPAVPGAGDPQLTTEGLGRADLWIFDAASPGSGLGGRPIAIKSFFADTPRALATDGTTVYVAAFHSGNQTTGILEAAVPNAFVNACGGSGQGVGLPGPSTNQAGAAAPQTGLIVKKSGANWLDSLGCTWNSSVVFDLPDHDVFALNANTLAEGTVFDHVGTILFNMVVNPATGKLYVTNTESPNQIRFEGPGNFGGSTVQGHLSEARVTVLSPSNGNVDPQHLNHHIDYDQLHTDAGANHATIDAQIPHSLATPLQAVVSSDGATVYVAAFGSAKVGVFGASALENPSFDAAVNPSYDPTTGSANYIATGGGPAGLALSSANNRLYVFTRFDQSISAYRVGSGPSQLFQRIRLPNPEPASVVDGRPFLYDAVATSGNGEASCASCHIFGDFDSLAWNLGNPDDVVTSNPQTQLVPAAANGPNFHPMKGPMTTQTLRGMATHGGLHWRGDRAELAGSCGGSTISNADCDERLAFENFNVAFEGLIGNQGQIAPADMLKFTDFALALTMPPNPVANIDGTQTGDQAAGQTTYFNHQSDGPLTCEFCHALDPSLGFFGTEGNQTDEGETQRFKIAHLRNAYQKIGMFGVPAVPGVTPGTGPTGPQVRGFGFLHDGGVDTLKTFVNAPVFSLDPGQDVQLEQFMLAFPSDLAPVVGQQVSIGPGASGSFGATDVNARITVLDQRAGTAFTSFVLGGATTECEVVVKTVEGGQTRGYVRLASGLYQPDIAAAAISEAALRAKANPAGNGQNLNYTCVPPGSGARMGIDRDLDDIFNGVDNCPAWANGPELGTCTGGTPALLGRPCSDNAECGGGGQCSLNQADSDNDGIGNVCESMAALPEPTPAGALAPGLALVWFLASQRRRFRLPRR